MRGIFFIFIFLFTSAYFDAVSQSTFSKSYDLEVGIENLPRDFVIWEDEIIIFTKHTCIEDNSICTSISYYDFEGDLKNIKVLKNTIPGFQNSVIIDEDSFLLCGHKDTTHTLERPSQIIKSDVDFDTPVYHEFLADADHVNNTYGILKHQGSYYLYGNKVDFVGHNTYGNILKIDSASLSIIGNWDYKIGEQGNKCLNLQATPDGNLAFILDYDGWAGPNGISGHKIVKIDTAGNEINAYDFGDLIYSTARLLVDNQGAFYFSSFNHPLLTGIPHQSYGRVNKFSSGLDSLEWSLVLPYNVFTDSREYEIKDYIQAQNGDIIVAGTVFHIDDENNANYNGFITRISLNGEIIWLKLYKLVLEVPSTSSSDFKHAYLYQIQETPEGGFIAIGASEYNTPDFEQVIELWLLSVNADGCLEGEECEEITVITAIENPISIDEFPPVYPNPVEDILYLPDFPNSTFELWDLQGRLFFSGVSQKRLIVKDLAPGFYYLKFFLKEEPDLIYKIIKK